MLEIVKIFGIIKLNILKSIINGIFIIKYECKDNKYIILDRLKSNVGESYTYISRLILIK